MKTALTIVALALLLLIGGLIWFAAQGHLSSDAIAAIAGILLGSATTSAVQFWLSDSDKRHELRMAALEKRLEAHQQAFALWRQLIFADERDIPHVVSDCQDWWDRNCLYLASAAREAFHRACVAAWMHNQLVLAHSDHTEVEAVWAQVASAGDIIVEGVHLPPIGPSESEAFIPTKPAGA